MLQFQNKLESSLNSRVFRRKKFPARAFKEHTYHPYIRTYIYITYIYIYNIYPILHYPPLILSRSPTNIPDFFHFYTCKCLARYARSPIIGERDTYRGNTIENRGCLFICLDVRMSFCTLTLRTFVFAPRSTPSQTSLNRILPFSDHYPYHLRN